MPSRAESRVLFERVLRGIVIGALAILLWQSLRDQTDFAGRSVSARGVALSGSLREWSSSPTISSLRVQLENIPSRVERAWLGALPAAGGKLTWSGDIAPTMIDAQPVASPAGGTTVTLAAPNGAPIVLRDEVGVIDSVTAERHGIGVVLRSAINRVTARVDGTVASTVLSDSVLLRKVLVIGSAGWESKFVVAALEEAGWKVDALIRVAPSIDVAQGFHTVIDTARYSAVIALDASSLPYASRIIQFARTGGGVVLSPQASRVEVLAVLRSGTVGPATADSRSALATGQANLGVLPLRPITSLSSDATVLERRSGAVSTAAKRIGAGRTFQIAYEDIWRWRMGVDEAAVRGHREWWTGLVSNVAYAPRIARATTIANTDEAPFVSLVAAIGPSTRGLTLSNLPRSAPAWTVWPFALLLIALAAEVMSRRLRRAS